ncbi:MAG: hypothetical protein IJY28_00630 [Clostridia bacterium]|nr:hypothetical protein [Clostridia bacterium]
MNYESIKEIRTVRGESVINELLATGKWRVIQLDCDECGMSAVLVRIRI